MCGDVVDEAGPAAERAVAQLAGPAVAAPEAAEGLGGSDLLLGPVGPVLLLLGPWRAVLGLAAAVVVALVAAVQVLSGGVPVVLVVVLAQVAQAAEGLAATEKK